jgi:class 3 adenylate cyclase
MQTVFSQLRQRWKKERGIKIGLGVGLDRGTVVMGSIGSSSHMNFGLVGDAVNTAHRLVEMARHGEIVVSEAVIEALGEKLKDWTFRSLPPVEIRHKSAPLPVYLAQPRKKRFL